MVCDAKASESCIVILTATGRFFKRSAKGILRRGLENVCAAVYTAQNGRGMYFVYFDTHAHYDDVKFDTDREELLAALPAKRIGMAVDCASDAAGAHRVLELAERYPYLYAAVGIHPEEAEGWKEADLAEIEALAGHEKVVAIGEIGLDYHYEDGADRETQRSLLRAQLTLAKELDLPVVIHDREAHEDSLAIVKEFEGVRGVFHCYSGSAEMAKELVKLGWMFSFGGSCTFRNARKTPEVIAALPADRIMLETDCPYLAPVPFRGKRCDSSMLPYICAAIAAFRGAEPTEIEEQTWKNALEFFRIRN